VEKKVYEKRKKGAAGIHGRLVTTQGQQRKRREQATSVHLFAPTTCPWISELGKAMESVKENVWEEKKGAARDTKGDEGRGKQG